VLCSFRARHEFFANVNKLDNFTIASFNVSFATTLFLLWHGFLPLYLIAGFTDEKESARLSKTKGGRSHKGLPGVTRASLSFANGCSHERKEMWK